MSNLSKCTIYILVLIFIVYRQICFETAYSAKYLRRHMDNRMFMFYVYIYWIFNLTNVKSNYLWYPSISLENISTITTNTVSQSSLHASKVYKNIIWQTLRITRILDSGILNRIIRYRDKFISWIRLYQLYLDKPYL